MRIRKKPWAGNELEINRYYVREPEAWRGRWRELFGPAGSSVPSRPIHLEIGCGKGRFILRTAAVNPLINFIALEREPMAIVSSMRAARESEGSVPAGSSGPPKAPAPPAGGCCL
jgi:tRNA (guanine-N7-)-methyltransferase